MRRLIAWLAWGAGAAFIFRWRLRRRRSPEPAVDPAEELKRKLDESRAQPAAPEPPPAEPEEPKAPLDERRREVHERGRAAIDEMRNRGVPPGT
jgi:hypothetical protein